MPTMPHRHGRTTPAMISPARQAAASAALLSREFL